MNQSVSSFDKLRIFTFFAAASIFSIALCDVYLEHNSIPNADIFMAMAGLSAFFLINFVGFYLINSLMNPLHKVIDDLNSESAEAASASSQVEAASYELAEACLEESASIQETAATLEETSSMIQQTTSNTQETANLSKQGMINAEKSYEEMKKLLVYMDKLKDSSENIFKIVKVIDTIAFQINILSINASIEAAKVGKDGNSFAIVAEEIRNLAQRTDEAAKNTEDIITENIKLVNEGFVLANDVEESLSEIDSESKRINALMAEISVASVEQAKGVDEIHKAISQMEIAVHSNAHSADECADAAKSLSSQADCVKETVDGLSLIIYGFVPEHNAVYKSNETKTKNKSGIFQLNPVSY